MSRPLLTRKELRRKIECYFNSIELENIQSQANQAGLPLSAYIRRATLGTKIITIPPLNVKAWQELSHTTANLNQMSKYLNNGEIHKIQPEVIHKLAEHVRQLRLQLLGVQE